MNALLSSTRTIPMLHNGDTLTRDEFERRYHAMPGVKKAELIEGVVFMPSPVAHEFHGGPHIDLAAFLALQRLFPDSR